MLLVLRRGGRCVAQSHRPNALLVRSLRVDGSRVAWRRYGNGRVWYLDDYRINWIHNDGRDCHPLISRMLCRLRSLRWTNSPRRTRSATGGVRASPDYLYSPTHRLSAVRLREIVAKDLRRREICFHRALKNISLCVLLCNDFELV